MAHTKAIGTTRLGRDSLPKYLGVKLYDGEMAKAGSIIVKQRGSKILAGEGARLASDYTIYSIQNGKVKYTTKKKKLFNGSRRLVKIVSVVAN